MSYPSLPLPPATSISLNHPLVNQRYAEASSELSDEFSSNDSIRKAQERALKVLARRRVVREIAATEIITSIGTPDQILADPAELNVSEDVATPEISDTSAQVSSDEETESAEAAASVPIEERIRSMTLRMHVESDTAEGGRPLFDSLFLIDPRKTDWENFNPLSIDHDSVLCNFGSLVEGDKFGYEGVDCEPNENGEYPPCYFSGRLTGRKTPVFCELNSYMTGSRQTLTINQLDEMVLKTDGSMLRLVPQKLDMDDFEDLKTYREVLTLRDNNSSIDPTGLFLPYSKV